jgi:4-amino-4-deoxy-L-arabinose transferase-like glycosyltransferase
VRLVPRSFPARLAAVVAVGVALRAIYLFTIARHVVGIGDWWFYHWQAQSIAQGHGFIEPWVLLGTGQYRASAIHPPLYPLVLSGFYKLGLHSTLAQRALGLGFGAITMVLIGLLGRRVGGAKLGLIAAAVYAVYPVMIAADGNLMSETLYGALIAGMLLAAVAVLDRPTWRRAALLGALIALAALTRTEALFFLPFLVLPVAWRAQPTWRGRGGLVLAAGIACAVVLAPWTIRNEAVFGRFVLVSTNDATVIAGANCDRTYHGTNIGGWDITCAAKITKTNEAAQAAIWRRQGIDYAENHLSRLPLVVVMRELRVWDLWQPRRQAKVFSEGVQIDVAQIGVAAYYVLMLLAIPGLLLLRRRARPLLLVLLSPAVVVIVSTAIGYGVPRLRHSFEIPLTVLAAAGIVSIQERLALRRRASDRSPLPASEHAAV